MTQKTFDIIGIGSPIVDSLVHVSDGFIESIDGAKGGMELVNAEQMQELISKVGSEIVEAPGGSAGNTIFALAKTGVQTTFLGKIGNDAGAEFYKNAYASMGGNTDHFKVGEVPNGRCLSMITPDSERTMRTDLGAAMGLSPEEITVEDFKDCKHAHIEGYLLFNPELLDKVVNCAKEAGCTTSIDLASFEVVHAAADRLPEILKNTIDIVFANEEEAEAYCGKDKTYEDMARDLAQLCSIAVVKLGKEGSLVCKGDELVEVEPVRVENVIDTTAAGDFWAAGFLHGWINGKSLKGAGQCGSLLGAEVVQVIGSVLSDETWSKLNKEFAEFK